MTRVALTLSTGLLVAAFVGPARADTTLVTPRITSDSTAFGHCDLVNAGTKPVVVTIAAVRFDGLVISQATDITIDPDHSTGITINGFNTFHCRFTGSFSKSKVRANGVIIAGHTVAAVAAQ